MPQPHRHIVLLLFLLTTACGRQTPTLPPLPRDAVIVAFGDSLTYGSGARDGYSYPADLERMIGRAVLNEGVPGEVTDEGRRRLPSVLEEDQPDLLLLCHGGNDLLRKVDKARTLANMRAMIGEAQRRHIPIVLIAVPRPTLLFLSSDDMYRLLADEFHLPLENEILARIEKDRSLKSDQIHPNEKGYRLLAEAVQRLLQRSGAI